VTDILRHFDIDDPQLPPEIKARALSSGGYPYKDRMGLDEYEERMYRLQVQLVRLQAHVTRHGERIVMLFEGRDAAGKGGAIKAYVQNLNPRYNTVVALPKPTERERTQWYFQRYIDWLPAAGETALFDRSWYNRAGVERVMRFASAQEISRFLEEVPEFEKGIARDGIHLFKFWLSIGREMQLKRFHDRRHDPLKTWKLSQMDIEALDKWHDYSEARDEMLRRTDTRHARWTVIRANDKRRARLAMIQTVLHHFDYDSKDEDAIGEVDPLIRMSAKDFLALDDIE